MKKILWISMCVPTPASNDAGAKTLNYYINQLARDYQITLIAKLRHNENIASADDKDYDAIYIDRASGIKRLHDCVISLNSKINPYYKYGNTLMKSSYLEIKQKLQELYSDGYRPDYIILEWTEMVLFIDEVIKLFPNAVYVASEHDVSYIGIKRKAEYFSGLKKKLFTIQYKTKKKNEIKALKKCELILVQNEDNKEVLARDGIDKKKIQWLCPYYSKMNNCQRTGAKRKKEILFFGAMGRPENYLSAIWFIENVFYQLTDPELCFVVVGSHPSDKLLKYAGERIKILGFVDDVQKYFEHALCFVAPLVLGAGIKVKILEALSSGIPVLTNQIGIEGVNAVSGKEYIHCEKPEDYIRVVSQLLEGNINFELINSNAKKLIDKNYNYQKSYIDYREKLLELN